MVIVRQTTGTQERNRRRARPFIKKVTLYGEASVQSRRSQSLGLPAALGS